MARRFGLLAVIVLACLVAGAAPALAALHPVAQASPNLTPVKPTGGPPWTYQMARLGIALVVLAAAGVGLAYYRFIAKPERDLRAERARERAAEKTSTDESTA